LDARNKLRGRYEDDPANVGAPGGINADAMDREVVVDQLRPGSLGELMLDDRRIGGVD